MRSMIIFLLVLLFATITCFSQEETDVTNVTKLTILSPGFSYEKSVRKQQTLKLEALMVFSAYFSWSSSFGNEAGVNFNPAFGIQYRHYYNAAKREGKGKRTAMNSLNYIGAVHQSMLVKRPWYDTVSSNSKHRFLNTVGFVWGIQRNYYNRLSIDFNVGLGYVFGKDLSSYFGHQPKGFGERYVLITGVDLGFWLNKRK